MSDTENPKPETTTETPAENADGPQFVPSSETPPPVDVEGPPAAAAEEAEAEAEAPAEEAAATDPYAAAAADAETLETGAEDRIIELEAQAADLNDKLLRALAETENVRRRAQREKEDATKYAVTNFAREMLAVADNLGRAMSAIDDDTRKLEAVENLMVGLEMVDKGLLTTFERFNIKPVDAMGQKFDHNLHEAMFEVEDKGQPAGTVMQVLETGYVLNDRLLRPAKVGVTKGGPAATASAQAEEPSEDDAAGRDGQTAYDQKGGEAGSRIDEEL